MVGIIIGCTPLTTVVMSPVLGYLVSKNMHVHDPSLDPRPYIIQRAERADSLGMAGGLG